MGLNHRFFQTATAASYEAQMLIVAGGAGGGGSDSASDGAGGGGAGGYRTSTQTLTSGTTYTVTVGGGGAAGTSTPRTAGGNGSLSKITGTGLTTIESAGGGGGGFGDIFDAFFGGTASRGGRARAQQGADVHLRMNISLYEAAFGTTREVPISRAELFSDCNGSKAEPGTSSQTCNNCRGAGQVRRVQNSLFGQFAQVVTCAICQGDGATISEKCRSCRGQGRKAAERTLEVKVPKGIETGHRLRLGHEGHAGAAKGLAGDAYIEVTVEKDEIFTRDGANLHCYVPISFTMAALGGEIEVPNLYPAVIIDLDLVCLGLVRQIVGD